MKVIDIKGPIVSSSDYWIYEWLGIEASCPKVVNKTLKGLSGEDITVEINSGGGSVFAGSEIYTSLKDYKGKVTVKIVGLAASAASVIAMSGDVIIMSPTAQLMIHNASTRKQGDYRDMEHTAEFLKGVNESISNAYKIKSGLTTDELLTLMDNETWMTAKTALELGLADEIMFEDTASQVVAGVDTSGILPPEVINKLRSALKQPNNQEENAVIEQELKNKLKELDLKFTLKGLK